MIPKLGSDIEISTVVALAPLALNSKASVAAATALKILAFITQPSPRRWAAGLSATTMGFIEGAA
jgi:hypothetical protein